MTLDELKADRVVKLQPSPNAVKSNATLDDKQHFITFSDFLELMNLRKKVKYSNYASLNGVMIDAPDTIIHESLMSVVKSHSTRR